MSADAKAPPGWHRRDGSRAMSDTVRDGLARAIRDAYATDIIPADTLLSDEGWSGLVGSVEEWHPEADAALAYLAGQRVDVDAVAEVLRAHDAELMSCADHDRYCCPAGDAHDFRSPYRHQAEQIAALLPTAPVRHEPGCHPDPTEDPYHGCECGAVGGQPHGRFAPTVYEAVTTAATGVDLIADERRRQVDEEGYTAEHDAEHTDDLALAAVSYAMPWRIRGYRPVLWPWDWRFWKPTPDDRVRELVKAGALIAAAIDAHRPTVDGAR